MNINELIERLDNDPTWRNDNLLKEAAQALRLLNDENAELRADAEVHDEQLTKVALIRLDLEAENKQLREDKRLLNDAAIVARDAIAQAPEDAFGSVGPAHDHPGYWIRDKLVDRITKAIAAVQEKSDANQ